MRASTRQILDLSVTCFSVGVLTLSSLDHSGQPAPARILAGAAALYLLARSIIALLNWWETR